jgi:trans-aconitate 2-methyltransferase
MMVLWRSSGEARYRDMVSVGPPADQGGWDGERYDRVADPQHRWGKAILPRLDLDGTEVVLDAGCGTGRVTEELLSRVPNGRVVALDASASMLDQARRRLRSWGPRVRFVQCDLLTLDPQLLGDDHPVDAVFSTATFHWIGDHDRLFANLASVLVPGGQLAAQCGAEGNVERVVRAALLVGLEQVGRWHFASTEETTRRLLRSGFTDVQVWAHPEPTPFPNEEALVEFLETGCLGEHLAALSAAKRHDVAERVAAAMEEPVIDYVRLNVVARRAEL